MFDVEIVDRSQVGKSGRHTQDGHGGGYAPHWGGILHGGRDRGGTSVGRVWGGTSMGRGGGVTPPMGRVGGETSLPMGRDGGSFTLGLRVGG